MHAFLTTFFHPDNAIAFFVFKIGVAQCTKSQIFCSKSLLYSHAKFKKIVEKTTRTTQNKINRSKKSILKSVKKADNFFEQNYTFWFTVQPFF